MTTLTASTAARAYLVVTLLLTLLFASPIQLTLTLFLLAIQLYSTIKTPKTGLNITLTLTTLILTPLALEALAGTYAFLLIIPTLPLLDETLKSYSPTQTTTFQGTGKKATNQLKTISLSLTTVFATSTLLWNPTLILTTTVLLAFIGLQTTNTLHKIPKHPLNESKTWSRTIAGNTQTTSFTIKNQAKTPLQIKLETTHPWINIKPSTFTLPTKENIKININFTPPLAGPSKIQIKTTSQDKHGLIQTGQIIQPFNLHIIPKAKYAQWLAKKFLEQTSSSGTDTTVFEAKTSNTMTKHGIEYQGNRPYQAGDPLKNIHWKHSYKLDELIVKEFSGTQGQTSIILANLTATNAETADKLSYDLVTTALTLATEGTPSGLALYNSLGETHILQPINPRETLKKTLKLTEKIIFTETKKRVLEPPKTTIHKHTLTQLEQNQNESANKLATILKLEAEANLKTTSTHPSTHALTKATEKIKGTATITVVSSLEEDQTALMYTLQMFKEKGFNTVIL